MDFNRLRKEYTTTGIDTGDLDPDPFRQFQAWFDLALTSSPGPWCEANAMTVATCGSELQPTARTVLLKGMSSAGFEFFTNYQSEKGTQLASNPRVSLLFHWAWLDRQVRIDGTATRTSRERSLDYFHSRPRGAQLGAHASRQSEPIPSRDVIDQRRRELDRQFADQPVPLPDHWGGFLVRPHRIEFWQGRLDRLHDRLVYHASEDGWILQRISP